MKKLVLLTAAIVTCLTGISTAAKEAPKPVALTDAGQKLEAKYAETLASLKTDITKGLPTANEKKMAAFGQAREDEAAADAALKAAQKAFGAINAGHGGVAHAKGKWIGGAEKGIAASQAKIKAAKTDEERKAAQEELAKWEQNKLDGLAALKERQAKLDEALANEPKLTKDRKDAEEALAKAQVNVLKALDKLGMDRVLKSDKLDAKLAQFAVITQATPKGLAQYAQQGRKHEKLIKQLLGDDDLMIQMAVADGAKSGKYGRTMEIYNAIQKASKKAKYGTLQRLALGISLEHAIPVGQRSATALTDAPKNIDPVKRYLQFEKAFLDGELDPLFKDLSVWDSRMVVNGNEPDETHVWGREMLRNYRPDHITTPDYRWRYVKAVRTDIRYGSQDNKYDKPEQQFFQNILMNGGVCGRRAFFGRFMLRSFGIPTTARPQRGHAALVHWTPDGWVVCLGGGWGIGWASGPGGPGGKRASDLDFLAVTQGRMTGAPYMQVMRAKWIGDALGEARAYGLIGGSSSFWNTVALYQQRAIIADAKAVALAAVGTDLGEANESKVKAAMEEVTITEADREIFVDKKGVITIPAVACSKPLKSTGKIIFMDSHLGGKQLHYSRVGGAEDFEYTFDAPKAGKYELVARVVTPSWRQHLSVAANGAKEPVDIKLPYTVGMWDTTEPVEIALAKGKNVLTFSRNHEGLKGMTVKDFTLTPVR
jgi:hypothetical protein